MSPSAPARSFAERAGVVSDDRVQAAHRLLSELRDRSLHSVRVCFVDQHGLLRTKTVPADRLADVVDNGIGVPGSLLAKDTGNTYAVPLWTPSGLATLDGLLGAQDMVMLPDPSTFRTLPWVEGTGWLLCDLFTTDARPVALSTRRLCGEAEAAVRALGYRVWAGLEIEFHLFDAASGEPVHRGWELLGEQHADAVHDRLEPLRAALTALGLAPRSIEIELGPGQIELSFAVSEGRALADEAVLIRSAVSQVCRRNGMHATFMCRPAVGDAFPSGWHLHQSLADHTGQNAFVAGGRDGGGEPGGGGGSGEPGRGGRGGGGGFGGGEPGEPGGGGEPGGAAGLLSSVGRHWVGGLLAHAAASCLLTTPTVNGYKRYRPNSVAPDRVAWSAQHRGAMLRIIGGGGDPATHVENRVGDSAANPYLYLAAQLVCGVAGLQQQLEPPPPTTSPYSPDAGERLPRSLGEAIDAFSNSALYRSVWSDEVVDYLTVLKRSEWNRFQAAVTDWEQREYFELF